LNTARLQEKFGLNDILPYLEISKPNLRNNLKQLFAMKNSILILCLLFAGVTFSQDSFVLEQPFYSSSKVDSILVFQLEAEGPIPNKTFFRGGLRNDFVIACQTSRGHKQVGSYSGKYAVHTFNEVGYYAVVCLRDGESSGITFFCVDNRFLRIKRNTGLSVPEPVGGNADSYVIG
jgi:hypothetical protein